MKTPMDISTVQKKLESGQYSALEEFMVDLRLIFSNAKIYNRKGDTVCVCVCVCVTCVCVCVS